MGLAIIARDEERSLPRLLESVEGAFDRVALLDTGSTDKTVEVFEAWGKSQDAEIRVGRFDWADDFAAARNAADELLGDVDWAAWADADDHVDGAANLRALAEQAPPQLVAFVCNYDYAFDPSGNVTCVLKRERLVRRGFGTWVGRVHEAQIFPRGGATTLVGPEVCNWVHRKPPDAPGSSDRNLRILSAWDQAEPDNARVLGYLGTEKAVLGQYAEAVEHFEAYLRLKTGWDQERAQIHRKLAICLLALERPADAQQTALQALAVIPDWPDSHLSLAEASYAMGETSRAPSDFDKAIKWATDVLRLGHPDSLLILNPLDYTFKPRLLLAAAHGALGHVDEAITLGQEALAIIPDHGQLQAHMASWRKAKERQHVADSWIAAAQILIAHDEQLKALALLEDTVPHFARDHPSVVQLRSEVRERLLWVKDPDAYARHYEVGGSKPEDAVADENVTDLCDRLPRAQFLKRGIAEQLEEAA